jgi:membrane protein implicated in regulation of membrane protease activity
MDSGSEWGKFIYFCINIVLVIISVLFSRKAFLVFGVVGAFWYLGYLSWDVFGDSIVFPIILTLAGLLIIFLGIKYARNQKKIETFVTSKLPKGLLNLMPPARK